ncbi:MAG TPA: class I SAM-dependent methyltransferase [Acidimicrobiales bacterium]|nr:class I SAM-dependent methyltransferase [Acidimicrobiales bacterium]
MRRLRPDGGFDGRAYQARFDELARQGHDMHGEADLVWSFSPTSVLDAGCGTGRVAIELARRGVSSVGVDRDESMLAEARLRSRDLPGDEASTEWICSDLIGMDLGRRFDLVVMAGNVALFTASDRRIEMVSAVAGHVAPRGRLVAGFQTDQGFDLADYDSACSDAGLSVEDRWSTWDRQRWRESSTYVVSVHLRRPPSS